MFSITGWWIIGSSFFMICYIRKMYGLRILQIFPCTLLYYPFNPHTSYIIFKKRWMHALYFFKKKYFFPHKSPQNAFTPTCIFRKEIQTLCYGSCSYYTQLDPEHVWNVLSWVWTSLCRFVHAWLGSKRSKIRS